MQRQRFGNLLADGHQRGQRGHRVLKDHRDALAANLEPFLFGGICGDIFTIKTDCAAVNVTVSVQHAHEGFG